MKVGQDTIRSKIHRDSLDRMKLAQPGIFFSAITLELAFTHVDKTAD